ncbi:hypothetical protein [Gangjinia marincola]|uniref:hypothetical protein n=1 Tax=Gangjinia marincola TaxID=578463 RepID=UPI0031D82C5A
MSNFKTIENAIETLRNKGYSLNFEVGKEQLFAYGIDSSFGPDEFEVNEIHVIENAALPTNNTVIYAVETTSHNKGIVEGDYRVENHPYLNKKLLYKLNRKTPS